MNCFEVRDEPYEDKVLETLDRFYHRHVQYAIIRQLFSTILTFIHSRHRPHCGRYSYDYI